jgi:RNA polymerase sigma factor (sigma-70 family)
MTAARINMLYRNALAGDKESAEELFEFLSARFGSFAHQRIWNDKDAEEVVQDALAVIFREFRTVAITTSFSAWAYKVLDNRILDYIKTKQRNASRLEKLAGDPAGALQHLADIDPELKRTLIRCLQKLGRANQQYARALNLMYQGYETDDICRRMNLKRSTLYSHLSRARSLLLACLKGGGVEI